MSGPDDDLHGTLRDWEQRQSLAETISSDQVRVGRATGRLSPEDLQAVARLRALLAQGRGLDVEYQLAGLLGQGGMSIVRLARQRVFDREVAIKQMKDELPTDTETLGMLQEAWITGSLQHPNVVPVYDVGFDDLDRPYTVFQRIEGVEWAELMSDEARFRMEFPIEDRHEWNLRVLAQVCNAVHYAHSRGIVHRDLKPSNVLIGPFGEVYLADWGIAISIEDDHGGRLPTSKGGTEIVGTPVYMAPEMLRPQDGEIGPLTDVYLLGAIAYEIVTGRAPHEHDKVVDVVRSISGPAVTAPADCAPELAALIDRALSIRPADRHPSALAFRRDLERYLSQRDARMLTRQAQARVGRLVELLTTPAPDRQQVYELLSETRFGFRQASALWRDNEAAVDGLRRVTEMVARWEIEQDNAPAAASLLAEVTEVSEDLRELVEREIGKLDAKRERLEELERRERALDPRVGARSRVVGAVVLGLTWTLAPLIGHLRSRAGPIDSHMPAVWSSLVFVLVTVVVGVLARDVIRRTLVNRRLYAIVLVSIVAALSFHAGGAILDVPTVTTTAMQIILSFLACGLTAVTVELRLMPAAILYLGAFFAAVTWPDLRYLMVSVGNGLATLNLVLVWSRMHGADAPR